MPRRTATATIRDEELLAADVGRRIREARQQRGMSLAQVAGGELSRSFLSLVELGKSRISLRALEIVARRLDLPVSYLLDEETSSRQESELLLDEAEIALVQRQPEECLRLLARVGTEHGQKIRGLSLKAEALVDSGRPAEAVPLLEEAVGTLAGRRGEPSAAALGFQLASALYASGSYAEALSQAQKSLDLLAKGPPDELLLAKATLLVGHLLYVQGDSEAAIHHYHRALEVFGPLRDLDSMGALYAGLSVAYKQRGDLTNALRYSKLSLGAFRGQRNLREMAGQMNNIADHLEEMGDLDEAARYGRDALAMAKETKAIEVEVAAHSTLASIYLRQGNEEAAEREAQAANNAEDADRHLYRIGAWKVLAHLAEKRGEYDRADSLYREALRLLKETGRESKYADAALVYSRVLQERGDLSAALDLARQAAEAKQARAR